MEKYSISIQFQFQRYLAQTAGDVTTWLVLMVPGTDCTADVTTWLVLMVPGTDCTADVTTRLVPMVRRC